MAGIKKSKFLGQSQVPAGATLDYVSGGTNYKIDYSDFLQGLGVSGEIVQVGDPLQVPILDDQGTIKGIRNIRGANGVTVSIDPDNSIKISIDGGDIGDIDWVSDKTYGSEDIVRSGARYYISLAGNNLGNPPVSNPSDWQDLAWQDQRPPYNTNAEMVADVSLALGQSVERIGYYAAGDGGGAKYIIVAGGTGTDDGGSFIDLDNGLQAKLVRAGTVTLAQFGGVEGVSDISPFLNNAVAYIGDGEAVEVSHGTYAMYWTTRLEYKSIVCSNGTATFELYGDNSVAGIVLAKSTGSKRSVIKDITLINKTRTGYCLELIGGDFPEFDNVYVDAAGIAKPLLIESENGNWLENGMMKNVSLWNSVTNSIDLICPDRGVNMGGFVNKFNWLNLECRGYPNGHAIYVDLQAITRANIKANMHTFISPQFDAVHDGHNLNVIKFNREVGRVGEAGGWVFNSPTFEVAIGTVPAAVDVFGVGEWVRALTVIGAVKFNYEGWVDKAALNQDSTSFFSTVDNEGFIIGLAKIETDRIVVNESVIADSMQTATIDTGTITKSVTYNGGITEVLPSTPTTVLTMPATARQKWRVTASPDDSVNSSYFIECVMIADSVGDIYAVSTISSAGASFSVTGNNLIINHSATGPINYNVYYTAEV